MNCPNCGHHQFYPQRGTTSVDAVGNTSTMYYCQECTWTAWINEPKDDQP